MTSRAVKARLEDIQAFRALFLQEANCQIRYDACHARGWTDTYLLELDGASVGYGSIKGQERSDRDTVFEFFVMPSFRKLTSVLFRELLVASGARYIECQTNDVLLSCMLYEFATNIRATVVLFSDHAVTEHIVPGAIVRGRRGNERVFDHEVEPVGDYVVESLGEIVATGGFLLHYNRPFADLFMEVRHDKRQQGYGSFLLQEVKKECYRAGRVPAARASLDNVASRATLIKAGLRVCGFVVIGTVATAGR